jgi:hypothetical protein
MLRLLVTADVVPSSPIIVTLMEVLSFSETSVLTRAARRNIPEDGILHSGIGSSFLSKEVALWDDVPSDLCENRRFGGTYLFHHRRLTWRNIPEGGIIHSHRREHLKSYIALTGSGL